MPTYFSMAAPAASLAGAIRDVLTRPTAFFRQMPADGSYGSSSILLLIVLAAPLMFGVFLGSGLIPHISLLWLMVAMPLALAGAWLWAAYLAWAVCRFSPCALSTRQAYQMYAYSNVPSLFSWIPVINIFTGMWSLYLQWKGLTAYAGVSGGKAVLILILPLFVLVASGIVLAVLIGIYLSQNPSQPNPMMMF